LATNSDPLFRSDAIWNASQQVEAADGCAIRQHAKATSFGPFVHHEGKIR
jgi:hypothetical protein